MTNDKGAKAPQTAAQRKKKQRDGLRAKGFVMVRFPELWVAPAVAAKIQTACAVIIANAKNEECS